MYICVYVSVYADREGVSSLCIAVLRAARQYRNSLGRNGHSTIAGNNKRLGPPLSI